MNFFKKAKTTWSKSTTSKYKLWTKDEVKKLIDLWEHSTVAEVCKALKRNKGQVLYMALQIRKSGYNLPKKIYPRRTNGMVKEVLRELNN
jgi:hypothetical protein